MNDRRYYHGSRFNEFMNVLYKRFSSLNDNNEQKYEIKYTINSIMSFRHFVLKGIELHLANVESIELN